LSSDVEDSHDDGLAAYARLREPRLTRAQGSGPIHLRIPERRATYYCMWCRWPLADDGRTRVEGLSYLHPGECALLRVCEACREHVWAPSVDVELDDES
jgi:hypothetical protein